MPRVLILLIGNYIGVAKCQHSAMFGKEHFSVTTDAVTNRRACRMDVTPRKRAKAVALREHANMSIREIASKLRLSKSTVGRIIKKNEVTGNPGAEKRGRCGRKRKTNAHDDKILLRNNVKDPQKTSQDLQRDLVSAGIQIESSTVRRRLLEVSRIARRPLKKALLTASMKLKRLAWAKKHKEWTKEDWTKVVFSDETHFEVHGIRSVVVRRSVGEPVRVGHIQQAPKHPPKKMFWGIFTANGPGRLVPVEGMMNSVKYQATLKTHLLPALRECFPNGDGIFQQDNAPCHVSKKTQCFFRTEKITVLEWPGNSPDINPIENLWAIMKRRIMGKDCSTMEKLICAVIQVWFHDEEVRNMCQKLVESMPSRITEVIKAKGGHISY